MFCRGRQGVRLRREVTCRDLWQMRGRVRGQGALVHLPAYAGFDRGVLRDSLRAEGREMCA